MIQDALLSSSRLELFKQGVDIVTAGDGANELYLVVAGNVQLRCAAGLVILFLGVARASIARVWLLSALTAHERMTHAHKSQLTSTANFTKSPFYGVGTRLNRRLALAFSSGFQYCSRAHGARPHNIRNTGRRLMLTPQWAMAAISLHTPTHTYCTHTAKASRAAQSCTGRRLMLIPQWSVAARSCEHLKTSTTHTVSCPQTQVAA